MPKGYPGTLTHGLSAYTGGRCKCEVCTAAARDYARKKYGHRPREVVNAEREPQHGTESRYRNRDCRCDACRAAALAARQRRRERNREAHLAYQREYNKRRRTRSSA